MGHGYRCTQGNNPEDEVVDVDIVRISLAFGLAVATLAQSIGHISGCNINPAVTVGLVTGRKMGVAKGALYIIAQCAGALIGAGILQVLFFLHDFIQRIRINIHCFGLYSNIISINLN